MAFVKQGMTVARGGTAVAGGPVCEGGPRAADLAPRDWLDIGQTLLKTGGLRALKLRGLTNALGASTGSFYHHFRDFEEYQAALADYFSGQQIDPLIAQLRASRRSPLGRIRAFAEHVREHELSQLALAMRAWAKSDPRAARAIRDHDRKVMAFLKEQLVAAGFSSAEAGIRAYALLAVGLGEVQRPEATSRVQLRDGLLKLLCEP